MKKNEKVSVVIVSYNGKGHLIKCLRSLEKQTYRQLEVIIVDNGSSDGTVEYIQKKYPKYRVLVQKENSGFAHGNNVGFKQASGSYIYFLNNDTELNKNAIAEMVFVLQKEHVGGVQSKLLLMESPDTLDTIGAFLTPTGFLYHNHFGEKDAKEFDTEIPLYTAKGASMMFKRNVLEKVEVCGWLFDPDYFAYFEETDLCHRVWLAGYTVVYAPKAVVYHVMGATSSTMNTAFIQYHSFKNRIATYLKNFSIPILLWFIPIHLLIILVYACIALTQGKVSIAWSIKRAIWWNLFSIQDIYKKREHIQKYIRKKSDSEILKNIYRSPDVSYYSALFTGKAYKKKI